MELKFNFDGFFLRLVQVLKTMIQIKFGCLFIAVMWSGGLDILYFVPLERHFIQQQLEFWTHQNPREE